MVARAWGLHPDDLQDTSGRTWAAMLDQLAKESHQ